jgi:hypothetical protein
MEHLREARTGALFARGKRLWKLIDEEIGSHVGL